MESRRLFYAGRITQSSRDPHALWRSVKSLLHTNHKPIAHKPGMCNVFMTHFADKVKKVKATVSAMRSQLTTCQQRDQSVIDTQLDCFTPTSVVEVLKLISCLPNKMSPLDYIHTSVLKACSDVFAPLIVHLANLTFTEGRFPDQFKLAQVTPLLKKAGLDVSDPANY